MNIFDRPIGILTIACEASTAAEQLGIAYTLFTRVAAGRWEPTVGAVCMQRYQFSEYLSDSGDNADLERVLKLDSTDPQIIAATNAFNTAYSKSEPDPTNGATHFFADSIAAPSWTKGATLCCKIGHTLFYRNVP